MNNLAIVQTPRFQPQDKDMTILAILETQIIVVGKGELEHGSYQMEFPHLASLENSSEIQSSQGSPQK